MLCIWRTRVHPDVGDAKDIVRPRPPSPVLIATHIACEVPRFPGRVAIAAFVAATVARCRERLEPLLDRELAVARERLDAADGERVERLARRDDAIEEALVAALRARATADGSLQPLLFEDIASEKTTTAGTAGELHEGCRSWVRASIGAPDQACDPTSPSLAMVLVIR